MVWKPILGGVIFALGFSLLGQLAFVLLSSYVATAEGPLAFLAEYKQQFWFIAAMTTHCLSMMVGGALTAYLSDVAPIRNGAIVGGLVSSISLFSSLTAGDLTFMGLVLLLLGTGSGALGAYLWVKWSGGKVEAALQEEKPV